jgi:hypothetical protein
MNQPAQPVKMRDSMPLTAEFVDRKRGDWGSAHVNDCIRRAAKGEPGFFYAIEGGHVLGAPFPDSDPMAHWQQYAIVCGVRFACFIRTPEGGMTHGTD